MKIYHVCGNGYKYDRRIFWAILGIILILVAGFGFSQGFDFSYKFYFNCDEVICENPYSDVTAPYNSVTGHKYLCTDDWCKQEYLTQGEYGQRVPKFFANFQYITLILIISGLILNHFIHNKGKMISIKPAIPDKYWDKIKKTIKEVDKGD